MRRQGGFTLIEVLVTMFIIAIGLLAAAGLQATTKKINFEAVQRTGATQAALAMAERLRGNPTQRAAYVTADAGAVTAAVDCASATCTAAKLVAYDLRNWARSLDGAEATVDGESAGGLVNPTGCIEATATANLYVITVAWRGSSGLAPESGAGRNTCGEGRNRYDDPAVPGVDERMRRIVVLQAYVSDPYATP